MMNNKVAQLCTAHEPPTKKPCDFSHKSRHSRASEKTGMTPKKRRFGEGQDQPDVAPGSKAGIDCLVDEKTLYETSLATHERDCLTLPKMELRRRYKAEANSHRNMLNRRKRNGATVHPDFMDFADFLRHVGPKPTRSATLDRIDNTDPEYGPGKVRWADKHTQNSNKSDTLVFCHLRQGRAYTASQLAVQQGVAANTIRKRRERGWSDDEIIRGERSIKTDSSVHNHKSAGAVERSTTAQTHMASAAAILFQRERASFEHCRREHGTEAVIPPFEEINQLFDDVPAYFPITSEKYERIFAARWPGYRPHVIFDNLPVSQQELVKKIDPDYFSHWCEQKALGEALAEEF